MSFASPLPGQMLGFNGFCQLIHRHRVELTVIVPGDHVEIVESYPVLDIISQLELEQALGGMVSLLTDEFLKPYLERTLMVLQRNNQLPKLPKGIVRPEIVAGVNALGRGQDRESLIQFITTIAQTMGPETLAKFINPDEYIKRLAAAQGIDYLNLVKSVSDVQQEQQQQQEMMAQQEMVKQAGQLASAPMMDPTKNPNAQEMYDGLTGNTEETEPPEA